jgi:tRNA dimethylallyltransferase
MIIDPNPQNNYPNILILSGPTASGKTQLALELAQYYGSEIISFDSRQFYKELSIGTAKPSPYQLAQVKHHFIGHKSIHEEYNAEIFSLEARDRIREISKTSKTLILVGGSGLYLNALLYSFDPIPKLDPSIRVYLNQIRENQGLPALQNLLLEKDPDYYNIVDLKNPQRIIRALEVCLGTDKPFSSFRQGRKNILPGKIIKLCILQPLPELYQRIESRVESMIREGLLAEAQKLFPFRDLNPLKTVGYTELFDFFLDKIPLGESINRIKQHTRNYAKRQLTWFRKDQENIWIDTPDPEKIVSILEKNGLSH